MESDHLLFEVGVTLNGELVCVIIVFTPGAIRMEGTMLLSAFAEQTMNEGGGEEERLLLRFTRN